MEKTTFGMPLYHMNTQPPKVKRGKIRLFLRRKLGSSNPESLQLNHFDFAKVLGDVQNVANTVSNVAGQVKSIGTTTGSVRSASPQPIYQNGKLVGTQYPDGSFVPTASTSMFDEKSILYVVGGVVLLLGAYFVFKKQS